MAAHAEEIPNTLADGPMIEGLDQDFVRASYGQNVFIDAERNAQVRESDVLLKKLVVTISNHQDPLNPYEAIDIDPTGGRIGLSDKANPGSVISVDGVVIGSIARSSDQWALVIDFNDNVSASAVQELVRSLIYVNTAEDYVISTSVIEVTIFDENGGNENSSVTVTSASEDKQIFSPGLDDFQGTDGSDVFYAPIYGIGFDDQLDGGDGDDTLILYGTAPSGYYLSNMAKFTGIEVIEAGKYSDTIILRADQFGDIREIRGGGGEDFLEIQGTDFVFPQIQLSGIEYIRIADDGATVTFDDIEYARIVSGTQFGNQTIILTTGILTDEERIAIHRRGIDTIITLEDEQTTTHHAPEIEALDGDRVRIVGGQAVHLDAGQNADIHSDDGLLSYLTVKITNSSDEADRLEIDTSGRVSLSNGYFFDSRVSVDGIEIGAVDTFYKSSYLGIVFNENATPELVREVLRALTYANVAGPISAPREIEIGLTDAGGRTSLESTVIVDPWEWSAVRVAEGQGAGTLVGTLTAKNSEGRDVVYELTGVSQDLFVLETNAQGDFDVVVKEGVVLDYENPDHRGFTVEVTIDNDTLERTFGLLLDNTDELPSATFESATVNEGADGGTPVGTIHVADPEGEVDCMLTVESEEFFELSAREGGGFTVKVKDGVVLDYENPAHRSFTIVLIDYVNPDMELTFNLDLADSNESPALSFNPVQVVEGAQGGTVVGTLTSQDPEGSSLQHTLFGASAGLFELRARSGGGFDVVVKAGVTLDYENLAHRSIGVRVSDGVNVVESTLDLLLGNRNEAPAASFAAVEVQEGAGNGAVVGRISAADPEGDAVSYTLVDKSADLFTLVSNAAGGYDVTVKDGIVLDYENDAHHRVQVSVTDGVNPFREVFNIDLRDKIDVWTGTRKNDVLKGQSGSDILRGLAGNDRLFGEAGADTLYGGLGNDSLKTGAGKDVLVFNTAPNGTSNRDRIVDFSVRDDTIWLDNKIFSKLGRQGSEENPLRLKKAFFSIDKAADADDYIVYNKASGALFYDADGAGTRYGAIKFAVVAKNLKITEKDFMIV